MAYPVTVTWRENGRGVTVDSPDQLTQLLDAVAGESDPSRPPLVMIGNDGGVLTMGLGAPVSTLNHVPPSGEPPYMICVGDGDLEGVADFFLAGHHTQFALRNTLPNHLARAAALEYAESGNLSNKIAWESC
jgi:Immunity protein Imm1